MTRNYTYRTDGKLTQMNVVFDNQWRCDPSISQVVTQTQYFFDALGRRVAKQTTFKPNLGRSMGPALGFTQSFSYLVNQDKILFSKSGDGILSLYLDGQGIDEHLGKVSRIGTQSFMTDHLGSVCPFCAMFGGFIYMKTLGSAKASTEKRTDLTSIAA
jgi:hypothetical protein